MWTKMAPSYATLTLVWQILEILEKNLYEIIGKKYNNNINRIY